MRHQRQAIVLRGIDRRQLGQVNHRIIGRMKRDIDRPL
jgi:hypothetical protein